MFRRRVQHARSKSESFSVITAGDGEREQRRSHSESSYYSGQRQQPIKGILRYASADESLHTVYGGSNSDDSIRSATSATTLTTNTTGSHPHMSGPAPASMRNLQHCQQQPPPLNSSRRCRSQSVLFTAIEIREYARTVGDNPSCSSGPPISYVFPTV